MRKIFLLLLLSSNLIWATPFRIELTNQNMKISSPKNSSDPVSIVISNSSTQRIHSEIRSKDKVLSRFVVIQGSSKTLQVKIPVESPLYYVTVSPPSQAVELKFNQRDYEIPEEK